MLFLWLPPQKYCFFPIYTNVLCFLRKYFRMQMQNQIFQSVWIRALWAIERISEPFLFTYRTSSRGTSVRGHCRHAFSRGLLWGRVSPLWTSLYFRILFQPPSDFCRRWRSRRHNAQTEVRVFQVHGRVPSALCCSVWDWAVRPAARPPLCPHTCVRPLLLRWDTCVSVIWPCHLWWFRQVAVSVCYGWPFWQTDDDFHPPKNISDTSDELLKQDLTDINGKAIHRLSRNLVWASVKLNSMRRIQILQ